MKWPLRKPREILVNIGGTDPINGLAFPVNVVHSRLELHHIIERKADPMPVRATMVYYNINGQRYQSYPMTIHGHASMKVDIPLAFLTGRDEDLSVYGQVEVMFEYQ